MKIICFSCGGENNAAARLRIFKYREYFENAGILFTVQNFLMIHRLPAKISQQMLQEVFGYDVLLLERIFLKKCDYIEIRKKNVKIIYDLDDAIFYVPSIQWPPLLKRGPDFLEYPKQLFRLLFRGGRFFSSRKKLLHEALEFADGLMVGNEFLLSYCKKFGKPAAVIPTPVDIDEISKEDHGEKKPVIIGWIGHPDGIHYIESIIGALRIINQKYGKRIVIRMCTKPGNYQLEGIDCDFVPWRIENEAEIISSFDIGIMPLTNDGWAKGKCAYKALRYMGAGIPVVLSPVGMNNDIVREGETGFFADDEKEWVGKISRLIENVTLRQQIGMASREFVAKNFERRIIFNKILDFLKEAVQII